jgi:hypothetical protein
MGEPREIDYLDRGYNNTAAARGVLQIKELIKAIDKFD